MSDIKQALAMQRMAHRDLNALGGTHLSDAPLDREGVMATVATLVSTIDAKIKTIQASITQP